MSIVITTDVFCDICYNWMWYSTGSRPQARSARKKARKAGWLRCRSPLSSRLIDVCPGCIGNAELWVHRLANSDKKLRPTQKKIKEDKNGSL